MEWYRQGQENCIEQKGETFPNKNQHSDQTGSDGKIHGIVTEQIVTIKIREEYETTVNTMTFY